MHILVIDNYDSFTYNLVHLIRSIGQYNMTVARNDKFKLESVEQYDKILISPGPGIPDEAGLVKKVIKQYAATKSILGVCLGHQAIAECFGAKLHNLKTVLHGVASQTQILEKDSLFTGLPEKIKVAHYHSWVVDEASVPETLKITSKNENGLIMSITHTNYDVKGVQFHPESVLTEYGKEMMINWLKH